MWACFTHRMLRRSRQQSGDVQQSLTSISKALLIVLPTTICVGAVGSGPLFTVHWCVNR